MTRILIAYASARGGTAGLAHMIADALRGDGAQIELCDLTERGAGGRIGLDRDAVIVAGSIYTMRWHRAARSFVRRRAAELRAVPTWLVASGPLDDSAANGAVRPDRQVERIAESIQAAGIEVFGGVLTPGAPGLIARSMAEKGMAGDWRNHDHIARWAGGVMSVLT